MNYFFFANIKINDEAEYQKYLVDAGAIFKKYRGKYLTFDNSPVLLEGNWNYTRCILIEFESRPDFESWYYSVEYQQILKHRLKAAICDTLLLKGL